jgi:GNAT superfamily N-acetyltransferase
MHPQVIPYGGPLYAASVQLRYRVLRAPLSRVYTPQEFEADTRDMHLALMNDAGVMLACCILVEESTETARLRQFAVDSTMQGRGAGRTLLAFAETVARERGHARLMLHARESAVGFYEACGYYRITALYDRIGIPHYDVEKVLG